MKIITTTLFTLAVAVSHVAAVVPIPIDECTKSVIVTPKDSTCTDFADRFGITFKDLLQWNLKLRRDCENLDVGQPICVSVSPGGINPPPVLKVAKPKVKTVKVNHVPSLDDETAKDPLPLDAVDKEQSQPLAEEKDPKGGDSKQQQEVSVAVPEFMGKLAGEPVVAFEDKGTMPVSNGVSELTASILMTLTGVAFTIAYHL